jgi:hypothetical protein
MLDSPKQAETGRAVVHVGGADAGARTVGPTAEVFTEYALVFEKGSTVIVEVMTQAENGKAFDLEPGTWALSVTAFIEVDEVKKPAVSGSISLSVAAGKTVQAKVTLTESVTDTYGTFDYAAIDLTAIDTATLKSAVMTLTPSNPNSGTVEIDLLKENDSKILELPAGIYTLLVGLTSGRSIAIGNFEHEMNAYRQETVYIYPYMTTALRAGEYEFVETDFTAGLRFTGTATIDPYSSGTDTYKPTEVHILKVIDNDGNKIDDSLGFDYRLIASESIEASIDDYGNWELILPSNLIADNIKVPFTSTDNQYQNLDGYPVFFCFTLQSQEHPNNTMQSRWVWQEINNKYGKQDIELEAKIRKITIPVKNADVTGGNVLKTSGDSDNKTRYDVLYIDDSDNNIQITVNIPANSGIIAEAVKVKYRETDILLTEEDDELVISPSWDWSYVYIAFKMPDADIEVTMPELDTDPKVGIAVVRNAENSNASYTAQRVFVWLDADKDGKADADKPIRVITVSGGSWQFKLPDEYKEYKGDFLFQLRLTKTDGNPEALMSKQIKVEVAQFAKDVEMIVLVAEIRNLWITGTGKGDVTITVPDMRNNLGDPISAPQLADGAYVAEGTEVQVVGYPSVVSLDNETLIPEPEDGASKTYKFIMPSNNTTVTLEYLVGDIGPAGGSIFYVEQDADTVTYQGWKYLEAAPQDALSPYNGSNNMNWMSLPNTDGEYYPVTTYPYIGSGRENTLSMIQTVKGNAGESAYINDENGAAKACDNFTYGGYDDWFLPSLNELTAMYTELKANGLGYFADTPYWSSMEYSNSEAYAVDFTDGSSAPREKHHQYLRVRPVRAF